MGLTERGEGGIGFLGVTNEEEDKGDDDGDVVLGMILACPSGVAGLSCCIGA